MNICTALHSFQISVYPLSHWFTVFTDIYSIHCMSGTLLGSKNANIWSLQLCELLRQRQLIISFFYSQGYWGPVRFEGLTQDHMAEKVHGQNSNPGLLMPILVHQPCSVPAHPASHPSAPSPSHCAKRWRRRWDEGRFFYLCLLCPPTHVCLLSVYVGVLSRKGCSRRGCFFLTCPFRSHVHLWEETCLQNILKISLMNLCLYQEGNKIKTPEFFPTLLSSIMIVLGLVAGRLVVESLA